MGWLLAHTLFSEVTRIYVQSIVSLHVPWPGADRMLQLCLAYTEMELLLIRERQKHSLPGWSRASLGFASPLSVPFCPFARINIPSLKAPSASVLSFPIASLSSLPVTLLTLIPA